MTDLETLREFYRDKLADTVRHVAGARNVRQYDANNTYQYIINREETQLSWVAAAIVAIGGTVDDIQALAATGVGADARAVESDIRSRRCQRCAGIRGPVVAANRRD